MRALLGLVAAFAVGACSVFRVSGPVVNGWELPNPAPLPAGAVSVPLLTEPIPATIPANTEMAACPAALITPFIARHVPADAARPIHYFADDGAEFVAIWPVGFSAWRTNELQIVAPDGKVFAREGVRVEGLGGGYWAGGGVAEAAHICMGEYAPHRVGP